MIGNKTSFYILFTIFLVWKIQHGVTESTDDEQRCQIPLNLENMIVKRHMQGNATMKPGDFVDEFEIVHLDCVINNVRRYSGSSLCIDGEFSEQFPKCRTVCDQSLLNDLSIIYEVYSSSDQYLEAFVYRYGIPVNSRVEIWCASGFRRNSRNTQNRVSNRQILHCLENGKFDQLIEPCIPGESNEKEV
ncbi:uncharacterized protein LOC105262073 [Musca domestica]|uniref:Uncharacterized protein LOC105262073 n=2 Tax=Musca domestica TaxID=7370 RepID=A0A9J7DA99_MUSDO|nr:uncharacterized protein LOC105262073 [Musca domestica]